MREGRLEATKLDKGGFRIFQTSVAALIEQNRTLDVAPSEDRLTLSAAKPSAGETRGLSVAPV